MLLSFRDTTTVAAAALDKINFCDYNSCAVCSESSILCLNKQPGALRHFLKSNFTNTSGFSRIKTIAFKLFCNATIDLTEINCSNFYAQTSIHVTLCAQQCNSFIFRNCNHHFTTCKSTMPIVETIETSTQSIISSTTSTSVGDFQNILFPTTQSTHVSTDATSKGTTSIQVPTISIITDEYFTPTTPMSTSTTEGLDKTTRLPQKYSAAPILNFFVEISEISNGTLKSIDSNFIANFTTQNTTSIDSIESFENYFFKLQWLTISIALFLCSTCIISILCILCIRECKHRRIERARSAQQAQIACDHVANCFAMENKGFYDSPSTVANNNNNNKPCCSKSLTYATPPIPTVSFNVKTDKCIITPKGAQQSETTRSSFDSVNMASSTQTNDEYESIC